MTKLQKFLFILVVLSLFVAGTGKFLLEKYLNVSDPAIKSAMMSGIIGVFYMFVPAVSVLIVEKWKLKKIFTDYQIRFKNMNIAQMLKFVLATAFLLPVIIMLFTYLFGNVLGLRDFGMLITANEDINQRMVNELPPFLLNLSSRLLIGFPLLIVVSGLFTGCTINLFFALGEEIAWRGFLEKELFIKGAWKPLVIGIIWGLWHTPLIVLMGHNYGEHYIWGIPVMVIVCIALAYYFSQALHRSSSLLIPAALHGIINAFSITFAADLLIKTGNPLLSAPMGLLFALSVTTVLFLFWLFRKRTAHEKT